MTIQTIAGISTPLGPGGIGIVRISGSCARLIMARLFVRHNHGDQGKGDAIPDDRFASHVVYYGQLIDPEKQDIIDEVLAIYMKAPKSFTREDVVEFQSHSGYVVLNRILSAVVDAGATLAVPGEFTKRAFLNGRIDLTQAEAVIDLINAPCETAAQMASQQVSGGLRDRIESLSATISALQARCEASIEFGDAVDLNNEHKNIQKTLEASVLPDVSALIQGQKDAAIFHDGVLMAIAGIPNVGKSSLLNRLVEKETAIVSEVPGTTRDIVRDYFSINGVPVVICDTAGIHNTVDPVECIGIKKARDHFQRADVVLLVLEATRRLNAVEEKLVDDLQPSRTIGVINKDDLADDTILPDIEKGLKDIPKIRVSAKFGTGINDLKNLIFTDLVSGKRTVGADGVVPNLRQRKVLEKTLKALRRCAANVENEQSLDVVSGELSEVLLALKEITGNRNAGDLYDHIFSQFCIGK